MAAKISEHMLNLSEIEECGQHYHVFMIEFKHWFYEVEQQ